MLDTTSEDGDSDDDSDPDNDDDNIGGEDHEIITEDDSPKTKSSHDSRKDEDLGDFPQDPYGEFNATVSREERSARISRTLEEYRAPKAPDLDSDQNQKVTGIKLSVANEPISETALISTPDFQIRRTVLHDFDRGTPPSAVQVSDDNVPLNLVQDVEQPKTPRRTVFRENLPEQEPRSFISSFRIASGSKDTNNVEPRHMVEQISDSSTGRPGQEQRIPQRLKNREGRRTRAFISNILPFFRDRTTIEEVNPTPTAKLGDYQSPNVTSREFTTGQLQSNSYLDSKASRFFNRRDTPKPGSTQLSSSLIRKSKSSLQKPCREHYESAEVLVNAEDEYFSRLTAGFGDQDKIQNQSTANTANDEANRDSVASPTQEGHILLLNINESSSIDGQGNTSDPEPPTLGHAVRQQPHLEPSVTKNAPEFFYNSAENKENSTSHKVANPRPDSPRPPPTTYSFLNFENRPDVSTTEWPRIRWKVPSKADGEFNDGRNSLAASRRLIDDSNPYRLGATATPAPRPTIRYSEDPGYAPGQSAFGGSDDVSVHGSLLDRAESGSRDKTISKKATIAARRHDRRIDDLADDLDATALRELMERDRRRIEKKKLAEKAKREKYLARRLERQKNVDAESMIARRSTSPSARESRETDH